MLNIDSAQRKQMKTISPEHRRPPSRYRRHAVRNCRFVCKHAIAVASSFTVNLCTNLFSFESKTLRTTSNLQCAITILITRLHFKRFICSEMSFVKFFHSAMQFMVTPDAPARSPLNISPHALAAATAQSWHDRTPERAQLKQVTENNPL